MDSTLVDFSDMKWQRGDLTFIFNGDVKGMFTALLYQKSKNQSGDFCQKRNFIVVQTFGLKVDDVASSLNIVICFLFINTS